MAESLIITAKGKNEKYAELLPQLNALLEPEPDLIACMANVTAALKTCMGFFWVGFYIVKGNELVLGPFQGPVACTRISKGRGVCGQCWKKGETIMVPDVDRFPGHIACSSLSKSEIVLPLFTEENEVFSVLDVDSDKADDFDEADKNNLEQICLMLRNKK